MTKTREEYLAICQVCTQRGFDMKKGVFCSLTNAQAAYTTEHCTNYMLDQSAEAEQKKVNDKREQDFQGLLIAGYLSIGLGLFMLSFGFLSIGSMSWALALIIGGSALLANAYSRRRKQRTGLKSKKTDASSEILDDTFT